MSKRRNIEPLVEHVLHSDMLDILEHIIRPAGREMCLRMLCVCRNWASIGRSAMHPLHRMLPEQIVTRLMCDADRGQVALVYSTLCYIATNLATASASGEPKLLFEVAPGEFKSRVPEKWVSICYGPQTTHALCKAAHQRSAGGMSLDSLVSELAWAHCIKGPYSMLDAEYIDCALVCLGEHVVSSRYDDVTLRVMSNCLKAALYTGQHHLIEVLVHKLKDVRFEPRPWTCAWASDFHKHPDFDKHPCLLDIFRVHGMPDDVAAMNRLFRCLWSGDATATANALTFVTEPADGVKADLIEHAIMGGNPETMRLLIHAFKFDDRVMATGIGQCLEEMQEESSYWWHFEHQRVKACTVIASMNDLAGREIRLGEHSLIYVVFIYYDVFRAMEGMKFELTDKKLLMQAWTDEQCTESGLQ